MRAIYQKREELSAIEVAEQQLGKIIDFTFTKPNISKELKRTLIRLRKSMDDAKHDHLRLVKTATVAEPASGSKGYEVYPGVRFRRKAKRCGGCYCS